MTDSGSWPSAPIAWRDAIVALAELGPVHPAERDVLLELLGLPRRSPIAPAGTVESKPSLPVVTTAAAVPPPTPQAPPPPKLETKPAPTAAVPAAISALPRSTLPRPAWLPTDATPALARASEQTARPSLPSLFGALETRGLCTATLATTVEAGELDVPRVVERLARAERLRALPRAAVRTLRRGVQLLLDRGASLEPFAADVDAFAHALAGLLGDSQVEALDFAYCPGRGVRTSRGVGLAPWRAPPLGVPVLIVSDFGVSGAALDAERTSPREWVRFAREVRGEGHELIGLTPFRAERWQPALAELIVFVHWSERASAAHIQRTRRERSGKSP